MPNRPARFTFLLDPPLKQAFERLCESQDITPSQMMRQLIKGHLATHGVRAAPPPAPKQRTRREA